jgi:hypothetical protein
VLSGGGAAMPDYRAYIIGRERRFIRSVQLQCADDEQAKAQAKQLVDDRDVELWQRDRLIDKFKSQ